MARGSGPKRAAAVPPASAARPRRQRMQRPRRSFPMQRTGLAPADRWDTWITLAPKNPRKYLPHREAILAKPWVAPFRRWLGHANLWHLNRHSVPGAVAIGLFAGMIPGPVQMLGALLLAIPCRSHVPLAMAITWYTNPLTIVPIY